MMQSDNWCKFPLHSTYLCKLLDILTIGFKAGLILGCASNSLAANIVNGNGDIVNGAWSQTIPQHISTNPDHVFALDKYFANGYSSESFFACIRDKGVERYVATYNTQIPNGMIIRPHLDKALNAGLKLDVYYAYNGSGGLTDTAIDRFLAEVDGYPIERVWIDIESYTPDFHNKMSHLKHRICDEPGYACGVYTNYYGMGQAGFYSAWQPIGELNTLPLWFASGNGVFNPNVSYLSGGFFGWYESSGNQLHLDSYACGTNIDVSVFNRSLFLESPVGMGDVDLVIESVQIDTEHASTGAPVRFTAKIKNSGDHAISSSKSIGVVFQINGETVTWGISKGLAAGATVEIAGESTWTPPKAGVFSYRAFVDDVDRISESNEQNNGFEEQFFEVTINKETANTGALRLATGMCLDLDYSQRFTDGGLVQLWTCSGQPNQQWTLTSSGQLINGYGKCLDLHSADIVKNGGKVHVWSCSGALNQYWEIESNGLVTNGYGRCLNAHASTVSINGGNVQSWACHIADNTRWYLVDQAAISTPDLYGCSATQPAAMVVGNLGGDSDVAIRTSPENLNGTGVIAWINNNESLAALSQREGVNVFDSTLGRSSSIWYQIQHNHQSAWINSLYAQRHMNIGNLSGDPSVALRSSPDSLSSSNVLEWVQDTTKVISIYSRQGVNVFDAALGRSSAEWHNVNVNGRIGWINELYLEQRCGEVEPLPSVPEGRLASFNREGWYLPVKSRTLSSNEHDHLRRGSINAWDISVPYGSPVYAMAKGVVTIVSCGNEGGYGCWVRIDHGEVNGELIKTSYAHMISGSHMVSVGQRVDENTQLGRIGWTGFTSFGPHVHFVIHKNGHAQTKVYNYFDIDQMNYCAFCSFVE